MEAGAFVETGLKRVCKVKFKGLGALKGKSKRFYLGAYFKLLLTQQELSTLET